MQHQLSNDLEKMAEEDLTFWMLKFILEVHKETVLTQLAVPNGLWAATTGTKDSAKHFILLSCMYLPTFRENLMPKLKG